MAFNDLSEMRGEELNFGGKKVTEIWMVLGKNLLSVYTGSDVSCTLTGGGVEVNCYFRKGNCRGNFSIFPRTEKLERSRSGC